MSVRAVRVEELSVHQRVVDAAAEVRVPVVGLLHPARGAPGGISVEVREGVHHAIHLDEHRHRHEGVGLR